jgi:NAD(P)-dependent dehydrogenase (short-subunit alcohol dehydrogenase family)
MVQGKTIIVTGATSGIGKTAATLFARDGARVVIAGREVEDGRAIERELTDAGGSAVFCKVDVSSEPEVQNLVEFTQGRFGRIDGAFNNAGVGQRMKLLEELTSQEFDESLAVNLRGVFLCMKHEIAAMRKTGGGAIVNTASVGSCVAVPQAAEYHAAKSGVSGLTRAAAAEARYTKVRVNAVLPGLILTPMIQQLVGTEEFKAVLAKNAVEERHSIGRLGRPEDVARAARWLLSDDSEFINGVMLPVDGGYLAR